MAYDLHGSWDNFTGHPSPLFPRKDETGPQAENNVVNENVTIVIVNIIKKIQTPEKLLLSS